MRIARLPGVALVLLVCSAAGQGCWTEQCDPQRSGVLYSPLGLPARLAWSHPLPGAVGCSTDGDVLLCASAGSNQSAVRLGPDGRTVWGLSLPAGAAATGVVKDGAVWLPGRAQLAAATASEGDIAWEAAAGVRGCPGLTANGYLLVGLSDGSLSAWDADQGNCWASIRLGEAPAGDFWAVEGSVAVVGSRGYVATRHSAGQGTRLWAVDVREEPVGRLDPQWWLPVPGLDTAAGLTARVGLDAAARVLLLGQLGLGSVRDEDSSGAVEWWAAAEGASSTFGIVQDPGTGGVWLANASSLALVGPAGELLACWPVQLGAARSRGTLLAGLNSSVMLAGWELAGAAAIDLANGRQIWRRTESVVGQFNTLGRLLVFASTDQIIALGDN